MTQCIIWTKITKLDNSSDGVFLADHWWHLYIKEVQNIQCEEKFDNFNLFQRTNDWHKKYRTKSEPTQFHNHLGIFLPSRASFAEYAVSVSENWIKACKGERESNVRLHLSKTYQTASKPRKKKNNNRNVCLLMLYNVFLNQFFELLRCHTEFIPWKSYNFFSQPTLRRGDSPKCLLFYVILGKIVQ